jgi:hypothetical protein
MTDDERPAPDSLRGKLRSLGRPDEERSDDERIDGGAERPDPTPAPEPKLPTDPPF